MIIAIGSFIKRKGMDILIKASKELDNNIKVYIIGGEITAEYENMLNNLHIDNVTFVNFMEKEKLLNYYRAADLFVLPTREDIWGLVINEALANGLPVITSKYCGAGLELIKNDYNGYIIDNNESPIEYANRINEYCSNDELLKSMSKNSLCSIENYTIENMANQTFEILKKLHY